MCYSLYGISTRTMRHYVNILDKCGLTTKSFTVSRTKDHSIVIGHLSKSVSQATIILKHLYGLRTFLVDFISYQTYCRLINSLKKLKDKLLLQCYDGLAVEYTFNPSTSWEDVKVIIILKSGGIIEHQIVNAITFITDDQIKGHKTREF